MIQSKPYDYKDFFIRSSYESNSLEELCSRLIYILCEQLEHTAGIGNMKFSAAAFLITQLLAISSSATTQDVSPIFHSIFDLTFDKYKNSAQEYLERITGLQGTISLERSIDTGGNNALQVIELTNSTTIVQLITKSNHTLVDCDISNSRHHIRKLVKHVSSKYKSFRSHTEPSAYPLYDMDHWIAECRRMHAKQLGISNGKESSINVIEEKAVKSIHINLEKISSQKVHAEVNKKLKRRRRGITDLMYPGKSLSWCYLHQQYYNNNIPYTQKIFISS